MGAIYDAFNPQIEQTGEETYYKRFFVDLNGNPTYARVENEGTNNPNERYQHHRQIAADILRNGGEYGDLYDLYRQVNERITSPLGLSNQDLFLMNYGYVYGDCETDTKIVQYSSLSTPQEFIDEIKNGPYNSTDIAEEIKEYPIDEQENIRQIYLLMFGERVGEERINDFFCIKK